MATRLWRRIFLLSIPAAACVLSAAPAVDIAKHVTEFQLANGMKFAVFERRDAPVAAFHLIVKAGTADEPAGKGGVARMFARMFLHGGEGAGSRNPAAERTALDKASQAYEKWRQLAAKKPPADMVDVSHAKVAFQIASEEAARYGNPHFFRELFGDAAAIRIDARVDADSSTYSAALQSRHAELWFKAVSDWLRKPSPRGFHAEREAMAEEAAKTPSLQTRMEAALVTAAFGSDGYGRIASADFADLSPADFEAFARTWYTPGNTVAAIVGDVPPAEAKRLAELYFGRIPAGPAPPARPAAAPKPASATAEIPAAEAPLTAVAWLRPPRSDADDPVLDVIWGLLTAGRKALLPLWLQKDKIPAGTSVLPNFPGDRRWSLFTIAAAPRVMVGSETVEKSLNGAAAALATQPVTAEDLERVKSMLRGRLLSEMESTPALAGLLARFLADDGSAAAVGAAIAKIERVTAEDVQRVAARCFSPERRVTLRSRMVGGL